MKLVEGCVRCCFRASWHWWGEYFFWQRHRLCVFPKYRRSPIGLLRRVLLHVQWHIQRMHRNRRCWFCEQHHKTECNRNEGWLSVQLVHRSQMSGYQGSSHSLHCMRRYYNCFIANYFVRLRFRTKKTSDHTGWSLFDSMQGLYMI